jgi:mannose-1-phosphate guanylyltransferase
MKKQTKRESLPVSVVLLAGGRGTRFWPRSRMRTPKQLLNIAGRETMVRETVSRLRPLVPLRNFWVVTNVEQAGAVRRELSGVPPSHILAEPVGRNTAAAIGLAAIHLVHAHGDSLMAVLPSDSYVADAPRYRALVQSALDLARAPGSMVVLGIPPTRPETGYGYIEAGKLASRSRGVGAYEVRRFTEKPGPAVARRYVASRKYLWNAGMFFWRASTFLDSLEAFLPKTHAGLMELAGAIGTRGEDAALKRIYPRLESISVDYAVMEPATRLPALGSARRAARGGARSTVKDAGRGWKGNAAKGADSKDGTFASMGANAPRVFVIPAKVGWSDIGSWAAVHELLAKESHGNVCAGPSIFLDADGNYVWSEKKFVAAIGVRDLVLVETPDALLLCARNRSQDVGKVVKWLKEQKQQRLL